MASRMYSRASQSWLFLGCLALADVVLGFSVDRHPAVVCVGEALFDCIATERGISVSEMTERLAFEAFAGGATANVAAACSKLGTSSAWIGCLGADSDGEEMKKILSSAGVNLDWIQQSTTQPTRRVMVTRNKDTGDR
jgi:fructokinase